MEELGRRGRWEHSPRRPLRPLALAGARGEPLEKRKLLALAMRRARCLRREMLLASCRPTKIPNEAWLTRRPRRLKLQRQALCARGGRDSLCKLRVWERDEGAVDAFLDDFCLSRCVCWISLPALVCHLPVSEEEAGWWCGGREGGGER